MRAANGRRALYLLLKAGVAHVRRLAVGDLLRKDRIVGDFIPVDLIFDISTVSKGDMEIKFKEGEDEHL